ncbi:MAG: FeoB-associated Cys-rich membrane protein [Clostridia bacterium]|nr:FeoB-associated Cys-rich membrane protein [Clostridia bacterium]
MSWIDAVILAIVLLAFGGAVGVAIRRRRSGKGCGCGCGSCPYHGICEKRPQ